MSIGVHDRALWVEYAIKSLRAKLSSFENSRFLFQNLESLIPIIHQSPYSSAWKLRKYRI